MSLILKHCILSESESGSFEPNKLTSGLLCQHVKWLTNKVRSHKSVHKPNLV